MPEPIINFGQQIITPEQFWAGMAMTLLKILHTV